MVSVEPVGGVPSPKEQQWRELVQKWQASGQTVRVFCAEHHLAEPSFYAWRRTIALRDQQRDPQLQPVTPSRSTAPSPLTSQEESDDRPVFVPVRVVSPVDASRLSRDVPVPAWLEVVVGPSRVVRIPPGFDPATLRQLLVVLEEPSPC